MLQKQKTKSMLGVVVLLVLCIIFGFALYSLSDIPFGIFFQTVFYFFCSSLTLVMLIIAYLCFKSNKRSLTWIGLVPTLLAIVVVILSLILAIDYRILYFKSLSPHPTKTEWIEDVHYLANQMAEKHGDLYSLIPEEKLTETVKEIEEHIPNMTDADILMALFQIAALPNDCHTFPFIMIPAFDLHSFPFKTFLFPDGLYIVDAGRDYKDLIGARILKIGSKPVEDIYNKLPLLLSYENMSSYKERFTYMVIMAEWLAHHGIIEDIGNANFTLLKYNGEQIDLSIPSIKFYPHFMWSSYFPIDNDAPPVYTNYRKDYYHYKLLEDSKTLYIQFNQCENQPERETMDQFVTRLDQLAQTHELDRCIVDIRNNDGGSRIWDGLLRFLKNHETINRHGSLFVLIGRRTFSSAVIFATQLQLQTNAILVGEPTGQGPVFYSRPELIDLPHSRLPFAISRQLTIAGVPFDKRRSIEPDIPVEYSISDFMTGRDPVLETAQTYKPSQRSEGKLSDLINKKYTGRYLLNPAEVMDIIGTDGNTLQVYLSDFLPNSDLRFESGLYPISTNEFNTDIAGVKIEFPAFSGGNADRIILNWMGDKHVLRRASLDYTTAFEAISKGDIDKGCVTLLEKKELYLAQYPNLEGTLNGLGYFHLRNQNTSDALKIFRLNVNLFPESYNVYDSYGEALMVNDQKDLAIQNYKKSLELNPNNKNAERVIKKLMRKQNLEVST